MTRGPLPAVREAWVRLRVELVGWIGSLDRRVRWVRSRLSCLPAQQGFQNLEERFWIKS
jgi:hypothetical protein